MWQPKVKTIAALQKGLIVLDAISESTNGLSLQDLHDRTRLPKATLLRLLLTLEQHGSVWRRHVDGAFCASHAPSRTASAQGLHHRLAECAADELDSLQEKIQWPSDLAVRHGFNMLLCETNRTTSYIVVHKDKLGFEINMLRSAVGRAYLAFCSEQERSEILSGLRMSERPGDILAHHPSQLEAILEETRHRGYGVRDASFGGDYDKPKSKFNDRLAAMAVPILKEDGVYGCLNIVWIESVFTIEAMAEKHLATLKNSAKRIAKRMQ